MVGHVYTSEYGDRVACRSSLEMRATSVGAGLSRSCASEKPPGYRGSAPASPGSPRTGAGPVLPDAPASAADSVSDVVVDDAITGHNPCPYRLRGRLGCCCLGGA